MVSSGKTHVEADSEDANSASLESLKQKCIAAIGLESFTQLYSVMKGQWNSSEADGSDMNRDLPTAVAKIIPEKHVDVVPLVYRILFEEEQQG